LLERFGSTDVGLDCARADADADSDVGGVRARVRRDLSLFDQGVDCFGGKNGEIKSFAALDPWFQRCGGTEFHRQGMADGALALPDDFVQRSLHAVGSQYANRGCLCKGALSKQKNDSADCDRYGCG